MKLIGISGTNGSGKDTIGQLLATEHNFLFISVSDLLRDEVRKRGLPVEREHLRTVSAEWRREGGLGVLIDKAIAQYQTAGGDDNYDGLVVSSLRNPGENQRVHELGGKVVWVDADPHQRYSRITSAERGRGGEDDISFDEFMRQEETEMNEKGDEATLNMAQVKARSDKHFMNIFDTIDELRDALTTIM